MPVKQRDQVLLFYKDFERDSFFKNDRYLKRLVKPAYGFLTRRPTVSGYTVWLQLLMSALKQAGKEVRLNDYASARRNPDMPVGLVGYPHLLDDWDLPNSAILGPSLYAHPEQAPNLLDDPRFKLYIVTCDWMEELFAPYYGDRLVLWHAGIDTEKWHDMSHDNKGTDVLIYDKVRWKRDHYETELIQPIKQFLERSNLKYQVIRYGAYDYRTYRSQLSDSKAMIFLCEHETQGMAYQEAMAANIPLMAWDNGFWLDPDAALYGSVPASSVPYFSEECGERFADFKEFEARFPVFWEKLASYRPREYVQRELSFEGSARLYSQYYESLFD